MSEIPTTADEATTPPAQAVPTEEIREVCHQAPPEAIWEVLEARGIETTPGVIYQAFNQAATAEPTAGLGAEDLTVLGTLATKAGGVAQLIRILTVWQEKPT